MRRTLFIALVALLAVSAMLPLASSFAQSSTVTITLAVPDNQHDVFNDKIIPDFQKDNPNIIVQLVSETQPNVGSTANDATAHLDAIQKLSSSGDVFLVRSTDVSAESTRAGYYLNLQPLIDSDKQINVPDFYPNIYRAFQWDQGMWALPISTDVTLLTYDPAAFDKVGIAYPTPQWTIDNLITAAKALTQTDSTGKVVTPGIELFGGNNDIPLYMSLLNKPMFDTSAIPNPPMIDQPEVAALLDKLPDLFAIVPQQSNTFGQAPIQIGSFRRLLFQRANDATRKGVLLPGGHAYLSVSGIAVSSGTQYPEQAYALARFITTRPDVATRGGAYAARQSLKGQTASSNAGNGGGPNFTIPAELQPLLEDAVANGYSTTDRRFYDYLNAAIRRITTDKLDTKAAIAAAQADATKAQQVALDRKADTSKVAVVPTPIPTVNPQDGITLKFGISAFGGTIPKKAEIQALADQFVQQNKGTVARVDIQSLQGGPNQIAQAVTRYDCFYLPYSAVPSVQLDTILSIDPFTSADKSYNAADFVGAALAQVQRDGKTYALPMNIAPTVMWYDPVAFANAGAPKPAAGWQIDAFNDALKALKPTIQGDLAPFAMQGDPGSSLLMLMAAYGGLPIDWRTNPPTVKFTDQANVDAMRQVLDLAKNKLIAYSALGENIIAFGGAAADDPLYSQQLNGLNFRGPRQNAANPADNKFTPVTFPKGGKNQAMSYSVGTLYISASAQNPDACYRWITAFSQHPELTNGMPARQSQLADPKLETTFGTGLATAYRDVGAVLNDPATITVPSLIDGRSSISTFILQHWLFEAWDNYVLKDQSLETGLADAQNYATGYLGCTASIAPFDPAQMKASDYQKQFADCAVKVDPRLSALRGFLN